MHVRAPHSAISNRPHLVPIGSHVGPATELATDQLPTLFEDWLADCLNRQQSERTIELRRMLAGRLFWFLENRQAAVCGVAELRAFQTYLRIGHTSEGGRWQHGDRKGSLAVQSSRPLRPVTILTYYAHLSSFFKWCVGEGLLAASPMASVPRPQAKTDQIEPFEPEEIDALLQAARRGACPHRDVALILFLLDTGARVTEAVNLRRRDVDFFAGRAQVVGKGNKKRSVHFGQGCARHLRAYLRHEDRNADLPLFTADRGDAPITRSGALQIIHKAGERAGIHTRRCSPHTMRHTFAVNFLKNGGNQFQLMQLLGHEAIETTTRYVKFSANSVHEAHRQASPVDNMLNGKKGRR